MRIGLVSYEYPPQSGLGGVGTYMFRLAGALGRAGHQVVVLAGPGDGDELQQPNVDVHRLPARFEPAVPSRFDIASRGLRFLYWNVVARFMDRANPVVWHWLRWDMATAQALRQIHARTPLDVIEAPEHAGNALMVGRLGLWPLVVRIHGPWDFFFKLNRTAGAAMNRLLAEVERKSIERADAVTAPSRSMAAYIARRWALARRPLAVPNFMDVPEEAPPLPDWGADDLPIVCAGRLERFKGQDVLVKAFARVSRRHPRARLVLIGPDQWCRGRTFAQEVDELVAGDRPVRGRIELLGPRPLAETQARLRTAAIAVVPSTGYESFSFSTLEGMAAGRPMICSRNGAMPELLDYGRCGLIVPPGDADALAGALDRLLSDGDEARALARCAHRRARQVYDTSAVLPAVLETYELARRRFAARHRPEEETGGLGEPALATG